MIYRLIYCNKNGVEARVDIQKGLATPVIEVEGTERPFVLSYNNDKGNKSGMFLSSSADIEIYETTDFNIDNLKTSNETELSVTHYINNVISWQGFIIPDFFSIEVRSNPVIAMTASDRLGTLKNVTLSDLPSMISLRELAILCLDKTGLSLPLRTMADFNNGTGVNDFFNSKILTQRLSDTKGRSISCYDILSSILTASNSFLVQRSGGWHIINKIQHEAGSGKLYTGATSFINWSDVIFNFSDISTGGRRTIIPVASTVGVFHEFGGSKTYPSNYDFKDGASGWTVNFPDEMEARFDNRNILGFDILVSGGGYQPVYGTETNNPHMVVYGFRGALNYVKSEDIVVPTGYGTDVEIKFDINASAPIWNFGSFQRMAVFAVKGTATKALVSGSFVPINEVTESQYMNRINFEQGTVYVGELARVATESFGVSGKLSDAEGLDGYTIHIRLYSSDRAYATVINFATINFAPVGEMAKGNLYKTERTDNYTKDHDIDTSLFADYITTGLNGYFYRYAIDDTSSLYNSANELTSKWTAYNDPEQLPLLQHITRQKSRLFSVAHDLLSAEIEASNFDPLAIFVACEKRYTVVSAQFDFFKSNLSVELEEVAFQSATVRDFIYSYFGDGESGIKSIGGISGGGGGGSTGGGLTPEQLEILSWWKKDPDNPNTIFTEMNAYSKLELSAYGVGDGGGGGGGGSDYERLDTWADYDSSKAGWVLSAFLGNDLNTRVTAIDGRVTDLENSAGSGSVTSVGISVPTGLSVANSPITSSGVIAIGLQTGYSIPTTVKQGQWDTAFGWGDHSNQNYFKSTYLRALSTQSYDANNGDNPGGFVGSYYAPSWLTNGAFTGYGGLITWKGYPGTGLKLQMQYDVGHLNPTGGRLAFRTSNSITDNDSYTTWKVLWHSGDFTSTEVTNWREVRTWWQNVGQYLKRDATNQALYTDENFYSTKEVSAYGIGSGGGSGGGIIETVYGYGNLGQTFNNNILTDTFNAYTINQINTRLVSVENGSATTVNTTGTGNAITSISKSGTVITANKSGSFLPLTGGSLTGNVTAPTFVGALSGNASSATNAGYLRVIQSNAGNPVWLPDNNSVDALKLKVYDVYEQTGTPSLYGNVLEINSIANHWKPQLWFDGSSHNIRYRNRVFNSTSWLPWKLIAFTDSNVASATKLQTPRTIAGVSFDGTANIAIPFANLSSKPTTLGEYGITDAVTLNTAQTITGEKTFTGNVIIKGAAANSPLKVRGIDGYIDSTGLLDNLYLNLASTKDIIMVRGGGNVSIGAASPSEKLHVVGNILASGTVTAPTFIGALSGNASSATKLQTARTIAGVSFDGTANIAIPFANLASKPTTLSGYGITDAYTKTEINSALNLKLDKSVFDDLFEKVEVSTGVFAIKAKYNFYSIGEVSAYGLGTGGSGGGSYDRLDAWADYDSTKSGWVLSALLGNELNTRVSNLEGGSALTVNTTGTGNAITSISKSGTVITANKDLTFSLSGHTHTISDITNLQTTLNSKLETSIFNTHNNDNVRHITGAERTKWDKVVTDFDELEIGGRNLILNTSNIWGTKTIASFGAQLDYIPIQDDWRGKAVTHSFEVKNIPAGESVQIRIDFYRPDNTYITLHYGNIVNLAGKSFVSYTVPTDTQYNRIRARIMPVNYTSNYTVSFRSEKLEFGNKPTDWSPAPEDQVPDWSTTDVNSLSFIKNKPTTLAGYGITDAVTLNTAQTITGEKTFTGNVTIGNILVGGDSGNRIDRNNGILYLQYSSANHLSLVNGGGNVGIGTGTASPIEKLEVTGSIASTGGTNGRYSVMSPSGLRSYGATSGWVQGHNFFLNNGTSLGFSSGAYASSASIFNYFFYGGAYTDPSVVILPNKNVGIGTTSPSQKLHVAGNILATGPITTPKVIFNAAGWSMEQVGSELQMKHNNVLKMRFTSAGSIVATEEITAFG